MRNPVTGHETPPLAVPKRDEAYPDEVIRREYAERQGALGLVYLERSYEGIEFHQFMADPPVGATQPVNNDFSSWMVTIKSNAPCDSVIVSAFVGANLVGLVGLDNQPLVVWDPNWNYLVPAAWLILPTSGGVPYYYEITVPRGFHQITAMPYYWSGVTGGSRFHGSVIFRNSKGEVTRNVGKSK
jgi:hypothetical protein